MHHKNITISVALIQNGSSYICLRRDDNHYKDYIEFPGGKLIKNETPSICLAREIKEELNINLKKYKFIGTLKHLYNDLLIIINVFKIFKYDGEIYSNEGRDIINYDVNYSHKILPTHNRIINLLKLPRLLKIVTVDDFNKNKLDTTYLTSLRLRDISYDFYKNNIKSELIFQKYSGNIIIDYPHNLNWKEHYHGVHFASNDLNKFNPDKKESFITYSASCHTLADIELCNTKLFDFVLVSPVLSSHNDYPILNWSGYSKLSKHSYLPTYALGGLSSVTENYEQCIKNNGFGIAGISKI
jgi:8-oxo-dGTP diphosphatase